MLEKSIGKQKDSCEITEMHPPIQFCVANGNEKYRQYMASAKIQNLYRNYRAKRKLKKIYNAQIATKIMNRKTPQPHLGREVANFL